MRRHGCPPSRMERALPASACLRAPASVCLYGSLPPGEPEEEGAEDKQTPPLPSNARSGGWKAKLCTRTNPNQFHRPVQLHPSFHLRYHHLKGMSTGYYMQQVSEKKRGKEERKRKNKKRRNTAKKDDGTAFARTAFAL